MELKHLRIIVAAADHPSLRQAAISLNIEQSKVTRTINVIEGWLGVPLFERTHRGSGLTHAGASFVEGARLIVEIADRIVADAKAIGRGTSGRLQIGVHSSLSAGHLRAMLAAFGEKAPGVSVELTEASRLRLLAHVRASTLDVAFIAGERAATGLDSAPAWFDRIVAALPPKHPLAARETIAWTDLAGEALIFSSRDPGPQLEAHLHNKLPATDMTKHIMRHTVAHASMAQLASAGLGIALLCEGSVEFGSHVTIREVHDAAGTSGLPYAAYFRREHDNPALRIFLRLLRERFP
ncbi:MAG: LysR family transcriptional regulator [Alphaproteobacteria bacterium]|nr:MAG: LysR family transcriptional regulator [Alphaproteobacteria bacterium]